MLEGSRESSVGWLICFSKPDRYVDILSNPWLESAATVGNYLLLISNMGLGIKLSIKGVWWETESSSARAASEWRPHLPHRHFTHRSNLGHQQMSLCSDEKLARSALAASPKTSGFMPSPASLLESVAGALVRRSPERLQGPTGLAGCCLQIQALILWFWMSWKGSIKFGGLMKRICSISCCIEEDWDTWLSSLRHFMKILAQDSLPVLPVLFSSCYDQNQSPFQDSWHTYVKMNHFLSCFYYCSYVVKRRMQSKIQKPQIFKCKCPCKWTLYPYGEKRSKLRFMVCSLALVLCVRKFAVRPKSNYLCVHKMVTIKLISAPSNFIFRFLHSLS